MQANPPVYYRAWGVDNIAYGPVELPALIQWVRSGRVLPSSWLFSEATGAWTRAEALPELKLFFKKEEGAAGEARKAPHGLKAGSLRRIKIFAEMDDRQLASFLEYMEVLKFPPNGALCREGEPGDGMYLVLEGEVRARVLVEGREVTLDTLGVGECFGEMAVLDESPRSADVIANSDSVVLKISAASLRKVFQEAPALAAPFLLALSRTMTGRIRKLTKRFEEFVHFSRAAKEI
ncbi:MAG TPA: cyclic nucleotide-binding domain-containing protein [Verrucomicrobiota bacterium]|nr:cyclic nucleotide-binding domain-containing protein [Verrucomicrobiota bacterium]HRZ39170.1 cyclic nucleotide-binding domain-containing protein [Candidatus Paceibacterota bacterium]HRZ57805.1 cyclic nucleotide-binding domain-containing protein [Candidatus Paceibacterota bacterium]